MPLSLFGYNPKSRVEDRIGTRSKFAHTFSGDANDIGLRFTNAPLPVHIIYRLDLRDPLVRIDLRNADYLPLLYCFNYGTECCYQVLSNTQVKLITPGKQKYYYPPWEAPDSFPQQTTSFSAKPYDAKNADDVMDWKGVFGWDELTGKERQRAIDLARQRTSLTRDDAPDDDWTYEDVINCMYDPPFMQSKPSNSCENPKCKKDRLRVIALQDNVASSELIWPDKYTQTIWEMCEKCRCIVASSQCT